MLPAAFHVHRETSGVRRRVPGLHGQKPRQGAAPAPSGAWRRLSRVTPGQLPHEHVRSPRQGEGGLGIE